MANAGGEGQDVNIRPLPMFRMEERRKQAGARYWIRVACGQNRPTSKSVGLPSMAGFARRREVMVSMVNFGDEPSAKIF